MPGTAQRLLVAVCRTNRDRLGARLKRRKERRTTRVFCFFTKRQDLSAEESRINIVKIILELKLDAQNVSGYLEALKVFRPDIFHTRILEKPL